MMHALHIEIFERNVGSTYPVVEHVFRGRTKKEAQGYFHSHLKTDEFLRDCVRKRSFKSITCWAESYWETY